MMYTHTGAEISPPKTSTEEEMVFLIARPALLHLIHDDASTGYLLFPEDGEEP